MNRAIIDKLWISIRGKWGFNVIAELEKKDANIQKIVKKAQKDGKLLVELVENLKTKNENVRYNSFKVLVQITEQKPELLNPYWDFLEEMLDAKNTFWLQSQREGFSESDLKKIKQTGLFNRLLFPAKTIEFLNSKEKVTGGEDHLNSNLIFTFAHGSYNLFEHGDVFIDSKGFPGVTTFARIYPTFRSDLSSKGSRICWH